MLTVHIFDIYIYINRIWHEITHKRLICHKTKPTNQPYSMSIIIVLLLPSFILSARPDSPPKKMKRSFFQAAIVSILLYACTTWTLTRRMGIKLDGNYTRRLRAILNMFWRQSSSYTDTYHPSRKLSTLD